MSTQWLFFLTVLAVVILLLRWRIGGVGDVIRYLKTEEGKQAGRGIGIFLLLAFAVALIGSPRPVHAEPSWRTFDYGEIYLGLDYTFQELASPCRGVPVLVETPYGLAVDTDAKGVGTDGRLTSNGGFRANILQSPNRRFEINGKYTHHSCALRGDRELYDAIGLEVTYRLW